jgi:hypothetical protein
MFPEPATTVKVNAKRQAPLLWVRRLIFFAKPGERIREVKLHRGLNIVWSADPGPADAMVGGRSKTGGHGAGKTLFCRMLRYCLGESTFATDGLTTAIGTAFPEGLVAAEVVVAGTTWGIVRPLGTPRKALVGTQTPEALLGGNARATGMGPFLRTVQDHLLGVEIDEHMPGTREWRSWLIALAWLARDQECAFGHLLEWRHPRSDSGSLRLSKEQSLVAARLLVDSMSAAEMETAAARDQLVAEKRKLEAEATYLAKSTGRMQRRIAAALEMTDIHLANELGPPALQARAQERRRIWEDQLSQEDLETDLLARRGELEQVRQKLAIIPKEIEHTKALAKLQEELLDVLKGERATLDADELKARLGPVCPVCAVPIDEALAVGCGLSHVLPDFEAIAADRARLTRRVDTCEQAIRQYQQQLGEKDAIRRQLEREVKSLRGHIAAAEHRRRTARAILRKEWLASAQLAEDARRLAKAHTERDAILRQIEQLTQEEGRLRDLIKAYREKHRETLVRIQQLFRYVCEGMLGTGAEATLTLTSQELRAKVQIGGTAMESLKVIALDIAVLLLSIEDRTRLPAFLVHDSPRASDLGLSHYHRLFRFMAKLEELGTPAPFQYVITTTTEPPEELRREPHLVAQLDGLDVEKRLLRRAL